MKTFYVRHTDEMDVDNATRQRLWDERWVAIHYPEGPHGLGSRDNESLNPADYPPNAAQNLRALLELAHDGGYVVAEHHGHLDRLVGRVDPGTPVELIRGMWGNVDGRWSNHEGRAGRPAVLKGVRLRDVRVLSPAEIGPVFQRRPPRGTLRRWKRAGDEIAALVDGEGAISQGDVNHWQRAYLAWEELTDFAEKRSPVTYDTLGALIGAHARAVQFALTPIHDYCLEHGLPPLTILVVNKGTRLPGAGFTAWPVAELEEGKEEVFAFDWRTYGNPFSFAADGTRKENLVAQLVSDPASAADVYATAKVRGVQMLFRDALMDIYEERCAFSGSTIREGLEAAHIVPWRHASHAERVDIRNGILLTTWHHRLFDAGLLSLSEDYRIHVDPEMLSSASEFDDVALGEMDGRLMYLPNDQRHRPDPLLIRKRNEIL